MVDPDSPVVDGVGNLVFTILIPHDDGCSLRSEAHVLEYGSESDTEHC